MFYFICFYTCTYRLTLDLTEKKIVCFEFQELSWYCKGIKIKQFVGCLHPQGAAHRRCFVGTLPTSLPWAAMRQSMHSEGPNLDTRSAWPSGSVVPAMSKQQREILHPAESSSTRAALISSHQRQVKPHGFSFVHALGKLNQCISSSHKFLQTCCLQNWVL